MLMFCVDVDRSRKSRVWMVRRASPARMASPERTESRARMERGASQPRKTASRAYQVLTKALRVKELQTFDSALAISDLSLMLVLILT